MALNYRLLGAALLWGGISVLPAQAVEPNPSCQTPALSRLTRHKIAPGETIDSIAQRYNLIPATLLGINPSLQTGQLPIGQNISIPPYNGIQVQVPAGKTWRDLSAQYRVRPDLLYEVNGCQENPRVVFVPGVNWSAIVHSPASGQPETATLSLESPLPAPAQLLLGYGWYVPSGAEKPVFHSGVDWQAAVKTPVRSAAAGTVTFARSQRAYGNLVVINHVEGYQTRYAQLATLTVKVGQVVKQGDKIGTVGQTGVPSSPQPHLHFEVRSSSKLGWVAEDPTRSIR